MKRDYTIYVNKEPSRKQLNYEMTMAEKIFARVEQPLVQSLAQEKLRSQLKGATEVRVVYRN